MNTKETTLTIKGKTYRVLLAFQIYKPDPKKKTTRIYIGDQLRKSRISVHKFHSGWEYQENPQPWAMYSIHFLDKDTNLTFKDFAESLGKEWILDLSAEKYYIEAYLGKIPDIEKRRRK